LLDLAPVVAVVREAGRAIMQVRAGASLDVREKGNGPVTAADLAANRILLDGLRSLLPEAGWLSEETADSEERLGCEVCWVVDPLDGTHEFISGSSSFAVSVGLVRDGEPVLGVLYFPAKEELYWARSGEGAWSGRGERLTVSPREDRLRLAVRYADLKREWLCRLRESQPAWRFTPYGSTVVKILRVATGGDEAYAAMSLYPYEWDICAAQLIVTEAGGRVTDLDGRPVRYNDAEPRQARGLLASNGVSHELLLRALRDVM